MLIDKVKKNVRIISQIGIAGWLYAWWSSKKTEIPFSLARFLFFVEGKWKKRQVHLHTYDGSNQCVHPDVIEYDGKQYITYTAYPYAYDFYENPQLAILNAYDNSWNTMICNPVAKPEDIERFHYSDPFLFSDNDILYLFFRKTDKGTAAKSILEYVTYDGKNVSDINQLTNEYDCEYISPMLLGYNGYNLFYVERGKTNRLFVRHFDVLDAAINKEHPGELVKMIGFSSNENIWHIGASSKDNMNSKYDKNGKFLSVVTYIVNNDYSKYYNCLCSLKYENYNWVIEKLKDICVKQNNGVSYYKGCLCDVGGTNYIYYSVIGKKQKHGVFYVPLEEVL